MGRQGLWRSAALPCGPLAVVVVAFRVLHRELSAAGAALSSPSRICPLDIPAGSEFTASGLMWCATLSGRLAAQSHPQAMMSDKLSPGKLTVRHDLRDGADFAFVIIVCSYHKLQDCISGPNVRGNGSQTTSIANAVDLNI